MTLLSHRIQYRPRPDSTARAQTGQPSEKILIRSEQPQHRILVTAFALLALCSILLSQEVAISQEPATQSPGKTKPVPKRAASIPKPDTPFQRWLPLPNGRSPDSAQLEELLRRSLPAPENKFLNPNDKSTPQKNPNAQEPPKPTPPTDADIRRLQDVIKEFSDQLPPNLRPKNLDGISNELLSKALEDPEVRKKAEQLIEQYQPNPSDAPSANDQESGLGKKATSQAQETSDDPFGTPEINRPANPPITTSQKEMLQSMEDFLKEAEDAEQKRSAASDSAAGESTAGESTAGDSPSPSQVPKKARGTSPEIKKQLNEKGFGPTIESIIEEAKKSSQGSSTPEDSATGRNNPSDPSSLRRAPKSTQSTSTPPSNRPSNSPSTPPLTPQLKPPSSFPSDPTAQREQTKVAPPDDANSWSAWLSKITEQVIEAAATQSEGKPSKDSPSSDPSASLNTRPFELTMPNGWIILAFLAAITGFIALFLYHRQSSPASRTLAGKNFQAGDYIQQPELIRDRTDVIRAFHQLAYRIAYPLETWSTHRRIESQVSRTSPAIQSPLHVITEVYEQARYLPTHVQLSEDQLASVRKAIQACEP